ncbi:MAG TPA: DUF3293 domain-containing protein [Moraxellaceae bacterium]|nr:DUF3293 domain-containing protein [Moraxellaceae bacterium]
MTSPCPDLIPDALWDAYAETLYVFRDEDSVGVLRTGALPDQTTEDVLTREVETSGAVVSAAWPQHGPLAGQEGDSGSLRDHLRADGYRFYAGAGMGMSPGDDAEPCFFVPGIAEADAIALGQAFGQNTVLIIERGRPSRLVACR